MSEKVDRLRERERELLRRIELAEKHKKKVIGISQGLLVQHKRRKISKHEYGEKLKEVLNGRDIQEWFDYYDDYIANCKDHLDICQRDIRKERVKVVSIRVLPFVFLGLFIMLILIGLFSIDFEGEILLSPEDESYLNEKVAVFQTEFFDEASGKTFGVEFIQYGTIAGEGAVKWEAIISSDEVAKLKAALPREAFDIEIISVEGAEEEVPEEEIEEPEIKIVDREDIESDIKIIEEDEDESSEEESIEEESEEQEVGEEVEEEEIPEEPIEEEVEELEEETEEENEEGEEQQEEEETEEETEESEGTEIEEESEEVEVEEEQETEEEIIEEETEDTEVEGDGVLFSPQVFEVKLVEIPTPGKRAVVRFFTPAVGKTEEIIRGNEKRISAANPSNVGYEKVKISSEVGSVLGEYGRERLRIINEETREEIVFELEETNGELFAVWFRDISSGVEENYLIIVITKAEHLDENRQFISDIFEEVSELDNVWSETIPSDEYVRVTFEIPLDSTRDITIYPRTVSGTPSIEVYEFEGTEIVALFESLNDNEYNKVLLTNLFNTQDTFDLRIVGGEVEFDHIIDPVTGSSNSTLAFFLASDSIYGTDGAIDGGSFDASPISLNDYGVLSEKCDIWDCSAWSETSDTDFAAYCSGGWECDSYNSALICESWTCQGWTESTQKSIDYCSGTWDCVAFTNGVCSDWTCSAFTTGTQKTDVYCSGGWNCLTYSDGACVEWDCTTWTNLGDQKIDVFCEGAWECTVFDATTNQCDNWACVGGFNTTGPQKKQSYCLGTYDCDSTSSDGVCGSWSCSERATASTDIYCSGGWDCASWDIINEICVSWDCLGWSTSTQDFDAYCSGSFQCIQFKPFTGISVEDIFVPSNMVKTVLTAFNVTVKNYDDVAHNNVNINIDITGLGNTIGWIFQPATPQLVNFAAGEQIDLFWDITADSGSMVGVYTVNFTEDFSLKPPLQL